MGNPQKAYLQTEGKVEYKGCEIGYYTYTLDNTPLNFNINVNLLLRPINNEYIMSLALDNSFKTETEAIKYGVAQGKKFIDSAYKDGRLK